MWLRGNQTTGSDLGKMTIYFCNTACNIQVFKLIYISIFQTVNQLNQVLFWAPILTLFITLLVADLNIAS